MIVIGVSKNMENRRNDFLAGVKRGKGHSEGNLFYLIDKYAGLKKKLESFEVEYTFQPKNTRKAAAISEEMLIKHYAKRFGEVPPLNSVLPGRYRIPW